MTEKELASYIIENLLAADFVIQRYDAYSTNSIYLKLDYGVMNSIRISNHTGKQYLKYRYNIGSNIKKFQNKIDKYPRFYYPEKQVDRMLDKIISDRDEKIRKYGNLRYHFYMEENKTKNSEKAGFWKQAKLVEKEKTV